MTKTSDLESEVLRRLVQVYQAHDGLGIYNKFILDYKNKHIDDRRTGNDWYEHRGEVFNRFILRYYLTSQRKQK